MHARKQNTCCGRALEQLFYEYFLFIFNEGGAAATQAPRRPGDILQTRSSSRPTRPDRLALSGDFDVIKNTQTHKKHSL